MALNSVLNRRKVLKTTPLLIGLSAGCTGGQEESSPTTQQAQQPQTERRTPRETTQTQSQTTTTTTPSYQEALGELTTNAEEEGEVFVRGLTHPGAEEVIGAEMEAETDVSFGASHNTVTKNIAQSLTEMQVGKLKADILATSSPAGRILAMKENVVKPNSMPPSIQYGQVSEFTKPDWDSENMWVNSAAFARVLIYNTDLVSKDEVPRTYDDIIDPKWENSFVVDTDGIGFMMRVLRANDSWEETLDYMEQIRPQIKRLRSSAFTATQDVAEGRVPMFLQGSSSLAIDFQTQGSPVDYVFTNNEAMIGAAVYGITREAPHPNSAKLYLDYAVRKETQRQLQEKEYNFALAPSLWPDRLRLVQETGEVWFEDVPFYVESQRKSGLQADAMLEIYQEKIGSI